MKISNISKRFSVEEGIANPERFRFFQHIVGDKYNEIFFSKEARKKPIKSEDELLRDD